MAKEQRESEEAAAAQANRQAEEKVVEEQKVEEPKAEATVDEPEGLIITVKGKQSLLTKNQKKKYRERKRLCIEGINSELEEMDKVTEDKAKEWAQDWMSIIDIEEDGTIDWESFEEFFSKTIEEDVYEENNMKALFIKLDQAKTGLV